MTCLPQLVQSQNLGLPTLVLFSEVPCMGQYRGGTEEACSCGCSVSRGFTNICEDELASSPQTMQRFSLWEHGWQKANSL